METHNFNPGPAILPPAVLRQVQSELLNFNNTGMSIIELSHRSPEFEKVIQDCEEDCRLLLGIPQNYKVLFVQGGASTQFSAVCYNLISDLSEPVDYICTGQWSKKAFLEAKRLGWYN